MLPHQKQKHGSTGIIDTFIQNYGPMFNQAIDSSVSAVQNAKQQWETRYIEEDAKSRLLDSEILSAADKYDPLSPPNKFAAVKIQPETDLRNYELKLVIAVTPTGGINGIPDKDSLEDFLSKAISLDCEAVVKALYDRLQHESWQTRGRSLCVSRELIKICVGDNYRKAMIENKLFMDKVYELQRDKRTFVQQMAKQLIQALGLVLSTDDINISRPKNVVARAAKAAANRRNPNEQLISVDPVTPLYFPSPSAPSIATSKLQRTVQPACPSPAVRKAAQASARRRSAEDRDAAGYPASAPVESFDLLGFEPTAPPAPSAPASIMLSRESRSNSGLSAFDFIGNTPASKDVQNQYAQPNQLDIGRNLRKNDVLRAARDPAYYSTRV